VFTDGDNKLASTAGAEKPAASSSKNANEDPFKLLVPYDEITSQFCDVFEVVVQLHGSPLLKSTLYGIAVEGTGAHVALAEVKGPTQPSETTQS
jgi:hypothetical protein